MAGIAHHVVLKEDQARSDTVGLDVLGVIDDCSVLSASTFTVHPLGTRKPTGIGLAQQRLLLARRRRASGATIAE